MTLKRLISTPIHFVLSHAFFISVSFALIWGAFNRNNNDITAESGTGYFLGILGGTLMLILLLYPISKRVKQLTRWIPIRYWFGIHMMLGVLGPVMILFHSNFQLGSINSSIALISMVLVAGSGLIGRYIYTHIHHGLYGARISLNELKLETENNHLELLKLYSMNEKINSRLRKMEARLMQAHSNIMISLLHVISSAFNAHRLKRQVMKLITCDLNNESYVLDNDAVIASVNRYTLALRKAAAIRVYERLFSLWHVLHLPLFYMMIITAIIHIFAVHLY